MTYGEYLARLSRVNAVDHQDAGTQAHLQGVAAPLDDLVLKARGAMLARLLAYAPDDAVRVLGAERRLQRFPGEYASAFRYRVLNAWEFWRWVGTVRGMLTALEHMGYGIRLAGLNGDTAQGMFPEGDAASVTLTHAAGEPVTPGTLSLTVDGETYDLDTLLVPDSFQYFELPPTRIIEHFREDPAIWAEFSLYLTPSRPELNADAWDDGSRWDDGTLWDLTIRQEELDRIRAVVGEIKPAHARLRGISLVSQWAQDDWDDGTTWDDGTLWDSARPTPLYLRPGA